LKQHLTKWTADRFALGWTGGPTVGAPTMTASSSCSGRTTSTPAGTPHPQHGQKVRPGSGHPSILKLLGAPFMPSLLGASVGRRCQTYHRPPHPPSARDVGRGCQSHHNLTSRDRPSTRVAGGSPILFLILSHLPPSSGAPSIRRALRRMGGRYAAKQLPPSRRDLHSR
jgi:hypothetical protein